MKTIITHADGSRTTASIGCGCANVLFGLAVVYVIAAPAQWPLLLAIPAWLLETLIAVAAVAMAARRRRFTSR